MNDEQHDAQNEEQVQVQMWDDDCPFDDEQSQKQIDGLLHYLGKTPKRILELGCGGGRVLVPVARAGHEYLGVDHDAHALQRCAVELTTTNTSAELQSCDFLQPWPPSITKYAGMFDAVLCLGNTFMTVFDVDDAVQLLVQCRLMLTTDGVVVLDDLANDHWPELTEGNWLSGMSEDERTQLVWAADDAVFALRHGEAVDEQCWDLREDDRRLRLWTAGAMRLAARAADLSGPQRLEEASLTVLRR